jgi:hypothetical protein
VDCRPRSSSIFSGAVQPFRIAWHLVIKPNPCILFFANSLTSNTLEMLPKKKLSCSLGGFIGRSYQIIDI